MATSVARDSNPLSGRLAVITGASSGIGRGIAIALARAGALVCALGRNAESLEETVAAARNYSRALSFQADITVPEDLLAPLKYLKEQGGVDILIHGAGVIRQNDMGGADIHDLDLQYSTNVRAPYMFTQQLLPLLISAQGQVVFINSSAGLTAKRPGIGQYAATKHALKAIADSLREEVNPKGVRVLTVFLGRTATPMQAALFRNEGKIYHPEMLLQPEEVATVVVNALSLPHTAEVTDISIRPMLRS